MPLELDDHRHLSAADGYISLGMFEQANHELEEIDPDVRHLPEVLGVRVLLFKETEKWDLMEVAAKKLAQDEPDQPWHWVHWAYAKRRTTSIAEAKVILLDGLARHPKVAVFHFNLACYECQLGNLDATRDYLQQCFELEPKYKVLALTDVDLERMWEFLNGDV